jgi:hypothetical protein
MAKKKARTHRGGAREGAGRKAKYPDEGATVPFTVRVPQSLLQRADAFAGARGLNRSGVVTEALRALLDTQ